MRPEKYSGWEKQRRTAFHRQRAQAKFRNEVWLLTYEDYCVFFSTEEMFQRRGRGKDSVCLSRIDPALPWTMTNSMLMTRHQQLWCKNRRNFNLPVDDVIRGEVPCSMV